MTDIKDGGPAFPRTVQRWNDSFEQRDGMTLRDYFAAKAMQAIIQADGIQYARVAAPEHAELAYLSADAMLAAKETGK